MSIVHNTDQTSSPVDMMTGTDDDMRLQEKVVQTIRNVSAVSEVAQVHLPRMEHDVFALLELLGRDTVATSNEQTDDVANMAGFVDMVSFDAFLSSWQYDRNVDMSALGRVLWQE